MASVFHIHTQKNHFTIIEPYISCFDIFFLFIIYDFSNRPISFALFSSFSAACNLIRMIMNKSFQKIRLRCSDTAEREREKQMSSTSSNGLPLSWRGNRFFFAFSPPESCVLEWFNLFYRKVSGSGYFLSIFFTFLKVKISSFKILAMWLYAKYENDKELDGKLRFSRYIAFYSLLQLSACKVNLLILSEPFL